MNKDDLIQFTEHLKHLFKAEGMVKEMSCEKAASGYLYAYIFHDYPDAGLMTVATYGLSEASHPRWHFGRPELLLCVDSKDETWADSLLRIVNEFYGEKSFSPGSVYELDKPVSTDSKMQGFVIFSPSFLKTEQTSIQLPSKLIYFSQAYPVYPGEAELIRNKSFHDFWSDERLVDVYDVKRVDISQKKF